MKAETLPIKLRKNGFDYTQVIRGKKAFIYEQHIDKDISAYEVFRLVIKPEHTINGRTYPSTEKFPANEDFGYTAWTYRNLEDARVKYFLLESTRKKSKDS